MVTPVPSPATALLTGSCAAVLASCTVAPAAYAWSNAIAADSSRAEISDWLRALEPLVVTIMIVFGCCESLVDVGLADDFFVDDWVAL